MSRTAASPTSLPRRVAVLGFARSGRALAGGASRAWRRGVGRRRPRRRGARGWSREIGRPAAPASSSAGSPEGAPRPAPTGSRSRPACRWIPPVVSRGAVPGYPGLRRDRDRLPHRGSGGASARPVDRGDGHQRKVDDERPGSPRCFRGPVGSPSGGARRQIGEPSQDFSVTWRLRDFVCEVVLLPARGDRSISRRTSPS